MPSENRKPLFFWSFQGVPKEKNGLNRSNHWRCSIKKLFLKVSQISQENTFARVSFIIKLQASVWHRCFTVNFPKLFKTPFLQKTWATVSAWNGLMSRIAALRKCEISLLTLYAPIPQNDQTLSNNSSANWRRIALVCLTILWYWRLKGQEKVKVLAVNETVLKIGQIDGCHYT